MKLNLKSKSECRFDAVSLGEVMLRLDPGEGRIRTARSFRAWEGGGFSSHFKTQAEMPVRMLRLNLVEGIGPVIQIAEGYTCT